MSKKYFARLSKSTATKRKTFWKKLGSYPFTKDEYDRAEKVPGDAKSETRPSQYNKKYREMYEAVHNEAPYLKWGIISPTGKVISGDEYKSSDNLNHASFLVRLGLEKEYDLNGKNSNYSRYAILKDVYGLTSIITIPGRAKIDSVIKAWKNIPMGDDILILLSKYNDDEYEGPSSKALSWLKQYKSKVQEEYDEISESRSIKALQKKAKASGVPYSILKRVYNRGMAAWVTGHRPGATQSAWAFARVNSFLTKGKTWYGPDADLAKKARKYLQEAHFIPQYFDWGWIDDRGNIQYPEEHDRTHTSILRRLTEKQPEYNLGDRPTETDATKQGWIRWVVEYSNSEFVLFFNTKKLIKTIKMYRSIENIVNKHKDSSYISFDLPRKFIQSRTRNEFMLELSKVFGIKEDQDYEIEMISGQLKKIIDLSTDTLNIIQNQSEIPAWIQDKISVSTHNAEAIFDYYNYSEEKIQEETQMKKVVIFPGGFHPFHKGHYSVYTAIKKKFPDADVYVASTNEQTERPFSFEDKKYLASQLGVPEKSFVEVKIPYVATEITRKYDKKNTIVIFAISGKDPDRISYTKKDGTPGYFAEWTGENVEPFESKGYIFITPKVDFKIAGKQVDSASMIRKMYKEADDSEKNQIIKDMYPGGDVKNIKKILDNNLIDSTQESVEIISETIRCSKKTGKNICFVFSKKGKKMGGPYSETKAKKRLRQIEFFKHLNK
jgi:hypothetical protein